MHGAAESQQCGHSGHMRTPNIGAIIARTCMEKSYRLKQGRVQLYRLRPPTFSVGKASRGGPGNFPIVYTLPLTDWKQNGVRDMELGFS